MIFIGDFKKRGEYTRPTYISHKWNIHHWNIRNLYIYFSLEMGWRNKIKIFSSLSCHSTKPLQNYGIQNKLLYSTDQCNGSVLKIIWIAKNILKASDKSSVIQAPCNKRTNNSKNCKTHIHTHIKFNISAKNLCNFRVLETAFFLSEI